MSLLEFAVRLRKKLKEETVSTLTMRYLNFHLMSELAAERGQERAVVEAFRLGFEAGITAMAELVRLEPMTASIKMGRALARAAWYLFSGKFPTRAEAYEPKPGHYLLIYEDEDCPWCREITGWRVPYCAYVAGMYEGAACCIHIASLKGERYAINREVRCKAAGDTACRFIMISVPISTSVSEALEIFKDKLGEDRELLFKHIPLEGIARHPEEVPA